MTNYILKISKERAENHGKKFLRNKKMMIFKAAFSFASALVIFFEQYRVYLWIN